jgi:type II secretory pathway pseudopilin PulG
MKPFTPSRLHALAPGYTMVAIVIFLLLLSISMMAVSPMVSKVMQREREEELIFRGKQYAQAFLNFQKRQGRYPLELKELMQTQPRSARKLFKEPICDCADWGLIRVGQPWPPPLIDPATGQPIPSPSSTNASPPQGAATAPVPPKPGIDAGFGNDAMFQKDDSEHSNVPIIGVYSKVHKKGLRTFKGEEFYDRWGFIAGQLNDDLPNIVPLPRNQPQPNPDPGVLGPPAPRTTPPN